jgi:hypothetical protein
MRCDKLAKNQRAEIAMFQILEVQEAPAFNGRRSFLTLRDSLCELSIWSGFGKRPTQPLRIALDAEPPDVC